MATRSSFGAAAVASALGAIAATVGCAAPPPVVAVAVTPPPERVAALPEMESEFGGMNEEAMDKAFASLGAGVEKCVAQGTQKTAALGGELKVKLRIGRDGAAKWAYAAESTLGDRETEKCVLELARAKTWPLPVGGDGLAQKSFNVDPAKEPVAVDEKKMPKFVAQARADSARCRHKVRGAFIATAYVEPSGKVAAAGVAAPNENAEEASDCMVDAIRKLKFRSGVGKQAKVSFEIR